MLCGIVKPDSPDGPTDTKRTEREIDKEAVPGRGFSGLWLIDDPEFFSIPPAFGEHRVAQTEDAPKEGEDDEENEAKDEKRMVDEGRATNGQGQEDEGQGDGDAETGHDAAQYKVVRLLGRRIVSIMASTQGTKLRYAASTSSCKAIAQHHLDV